MAFPENFLWGVATASYQIEGAPYKVGGGLSVWDMFCKRPGAVADQSNGDVACDHYNRYQEDAQLMGKLGYPNYRMSISWPRVMPTGTGEVSAEGLAFYDRLVDSLLENGVTPHVTLYHWDTPHDVYLRGGWLNRDISDWFADYTEVVVSKLGDRVKSWMTLNEPQCFIGLGMQSGVHAPGDKLNMEELLWASHNALLSHGKCVQAIRANSQGPCEIGWAPVGVCVIPATDDPADVEAARKRTMEMQDLDLWSTALWNDPVFLGEYPKVVAEAFEKSHLKPRAGDMETICQPLDFYGANIYNAGIVKAGPNGTIENVPHHLGMGRTIYHWPITPSALYWGPKFFYEKYKKPIVITENGMGLSDWVALDGKVHDPQRIDFLHRYIREFQRAGEDGVEIKGYFQWSFMDNFEWYEGYKFRFGLVYVDYQTQQRIPKDSAYWYSDVINSNGANL